MADLRNAERCHGWRMEAYRASRGQRQGEKVRVMDTEEHDNATAKKVLNFCFYSGSFYACSTHSLWFPLPLQKTAVLNSYMGRRQVGVS